MLAHLGIICAIAGAILALIGAVGIFTTSSSPGSSSGLSGVCLGLGMLTAFGAPLAINALGGPKSTTPERVVVTKTVKLASLANGTTTTSTTVHSFLSSPTTTDQHPIYQFVRENSDNSYSIDTIDGTTHVKEDATASTARIETTRCEYLDQKVVQNWGRWCGDDVTTIHVPSGSIVRNFSIDARKQ